LVGYRGARCRSPVGVTVGAGCVVGAIACHVAVTCCGPRTCAIIYRGTIIHRLAVIAAS